MLFIDNACVPSRCQNRLGGGGLGKFSVPDWPSEEDEATKVSAARISPE